MAKKKPKFDKDKLQKKQDARVLLTAPREKEKTDEELRQTIVAILDYLGIEVNYTD